MVVCIAGSRTTRVAATGASNSLPRPRKQGECFVFKKRVDLVSVRVSPIRANKIENEREKNK